MTTQIFCRHRLKLAGVLVGLIAIAHPARSADVGTAFTYQGSLSDAGSAATGPYDFRFTLFDAAAGGAQKGQLALEDVSVVSGIFSVDLDFGGAWQITEASWLLIEVRPGSSTGAYTALPRQKLNPAPYAIGLSLPRYQQAGSSGSLYSLLNTGTGNGASFQAGPGTTLSYGVVGGTGSSASQAAGVRGIATATSGLTIGVEGVATSSTSGTGLVGTGYATGAYISATGTSSTGLYSYGGGTGTYTEASNSLSTGLYAKGGFRGVYAESRGIGPALEARRASGTGDLILAANSSGSQFWVGNDGVTHVKVLEILGGADFSERFDIGGDADAKIEPGSVVSIDPAHEGRLTPSREPYDRRVAGITSGAGGVRPGMLMGQEGTVATGAHPVALTGRVYCRATAANGPIAPGDLLTTSSVPGRAMRVGDPRRAQGAILGKAMGSLPRGEGLVLVLVGLQ